MKEYDEKGNIIYRKDSAGFEQWMRYDKNNNEINYKNKYGECWKEYDINNNCIYYKSSNGYEERRKYDKNNNEIYYIDSNGREECYKYKNNEQMIITKKEFEYIQFFSRKRVPRYEILDI